MGRHCEVKTVKKRLADVIRWAEKQGFFNIAEELRSVLADMSDK
jgi:hypothetical protein